MAEFIPAILAHDTSTVTQQVRVLNRLTNRVHLDFADETLVPNQTVLPADLLDLVTTLEIDAHLMVDRPTAYFGSLAHMGVGRIIVHLEALQPLEEALDEAQVYGFIVGLAVNPDASLESVAPYVGAIDHLLIMGVEPGFTGQVFVEQTYDRVRQANLLYPHLPIAVDGGVRLAKAAPLLESGADMLIASPAGYQVDGSVEKGLQQWQQTLSVYRPTNP